MRIRSAFLALTLLCGPALGQPYMTPATGFAEFENPNNSLIEWAFPVEVLWQVDAKGKGHIHLEAQTKAYTHTDGVTYGPGTFVKNNASGKFVIDVGSDLPANPPQFWWPPGSTPQQPPNKYGQDLKSMGSCADTIGIVPNAFSEGYSELVPQVLMHQGFLQIRLLLKGLGKPLKPLTAAYFISSGEIRIECDAFYMVGQ